MKSICVTSLFWIIFIAIPSGRAQGESPVDRLTQQFEGAKGRELVPLDSEQGATEAAYVEQLDKLEKKLMGNGDLEALLQVRKEREVFMSSKVVGGGELDDIAPLRENYKKERTACCEAIQG